MSFPQLRSPIPFEQLVGELREACVRAGMDQKCYVELDDALTTEHRTNPRRYAAVTASAQNPTFFFAEQTLWLPYANRLGLYAHEIGHVMDPDPAKTEEGADLHGMLAVGVLIIYDRRWPGKGLQAAAW